MRLTAEGDHAAPSADDPAENVLVEGWCQQTSSHSIGDLEFGPEGKLFASGGEGASFSTIDYGEVGWPHKNQCNDPPGGESLAPPSAEGGSLRAQDVRTPADPTGLSGTVIRVDPDTGAGLPGNPFGSSADLNARRIVGFGLRNPFRFTIDDETDEIYVNNVGGGPIEEIDRMATVPATAYNSGWPCYEGSEPNQNFQALGLSLCESLYATPGAASSPFFSYRHADGVAPGDPCPKGEGSDITGSIFYDGSDFPSSYEDAFFFADSVFGCIYVMFPGPDGRPDPSSVTPFLVEDSTFRYPGVDIHVGPDGALYYASLLGPGFGPGSIHRVAYFSGNRPPVARLTASPEYGPTPLIPAFDASGSSDADGEPLTYEWDLDGDGIFTGPNAPSVSTTFNDNQNHTAAVRVEDSHGASSVARVTVFPGDTPPQPAISTPAESAEPGKAVGSWAVGSTIHFSGGAVDAEDGTLPGTSLDWISRLYHCPGSGCHAHPLQAFPHALAGDLVAPEHEYPSRIELKLTATDSRGLQATRSISVYARPFTVSVSSSPPGLPLGLGPLNQAAPFSLTAIEDATLTLAAPATVQAGGRTYNWISWSDGGARVHTITAAGPVSAYRATYSGGEPNQKGPGPDEPGPSPAPPSTRLLSHPDKHSASRRGRFAFKGSETATSFFCRLDRARYRPCRSPRIYAGLAPGWHVFKVIAGDAGGRFDPSPATFRWKVLR